jgi:hypothetical protein
MRYGFTLPGRGPLATPDSLAAIARRAEELGYHLLLFGDHIVVPKHISSPYPYTETGEFPGSASGEAMEQSHHRWSNARLIYRGTPSLRGQR